MGTGDPHAMVLVWVTSALAHYVATSNYGDLRVGEPGYHLDFDPDTVRCPQLGLDSAGPHTARYSRLPQPGAQLGGRGQVTPQLQPRNGGKSVDVAQLWLATSMGSGPGTQHRNGLLPRRRPATPG